MNYRLLAKYLGHFAIAIGVLMLLPAAWAVYFREWNALLAFVLSVGLSCLFGAVLALAGRNAPERLYQREALGLVGLCWLVAAALGAMPYVFSGLFGPVDAYFESMSGFTTTGSSVLVDIEATAKSMLFWRSFTHWLGGMGIVVLFIAVLPYLGVGGKQLFKSESPGPDPQGLRPRIKDTASILYKIYLAFTVAETLALMLAGMSFYDALCHTFGTLATGGFSTRQASIGAYDSVAVDAIIIFFMFCAGANFVLYFAMLRGDWKAPWKDTEWRVYLGVLVLCTIAVTLSLLGVGASGEEQMHYPTVGSAFRYASFQVVSIMTTTGFCTADFDQWPHFSRMLLILLMFVGGCAGSTGGGIKIIRIIILLKMAYWRLEYAFRPKTVRAIRVNGAVVDDNVQRTIYAFFVLYLLWFAGGTLFMSFLGLPFQSAVSSVAATLNNIGPGLELVGATHDYHLIPAVGKVFLSLCMVLGRLELFSICVLFVPAFWRR
ncbi:MAG: TrkH family potassium uptake protein [Nitrospiraceae bacterium]|nr:TrkH family potassium uptake protein [Nitrospiraceae bacterium]